MSADDRHLASLHELADELAALVATDKPWAEIGRGASRLLGEYHRREIDALEVAVWCARSLALQTALAGRLPDVAAA